MDNTRYRLEKAVLSRYLPSNAFLFKDINTPHPYVLLGVRTNNRKIYTIRVELDDFPNAVPKVFVTQMLKRKNGTDMDDASHAMHTLSSENGWTRICHSDSGKWSPQNSLYMVYLKCKLWLDMYEAHLVTGKSISYYLCGDN